MKQKQNPEATRRFVAAMGARLLLADLKRDQSGELRWTDAELRGAEISLGFSPGTKRVLREVAFSVNENMVSFCKQAALDRIHSILEARIAADTDEPAGEET